MTEDAKASAAPYISFRTLLTLLDKLNSGGIPQHIDRHYWGSFLAGSTGQQVIAALRFLGLIDPDNNEPTPMLERLVDPNQRKAALAEILRDRYAGLVSRGVDVSRTTPGHLEKAFGELYGVEGETRRKAVTFYVHAAKFADVALSSQITAKTRQRRAPTSRTRARSPQSPPTSKLSEQPPPKDQPPVTQDTGPYAILHALLDKLPVDGHWTSGTRKRWLDALQANVDFLVSVEDESADGDDYDYADYGDEEEEEIAR